jgi:hypothetical protein
MLANNYRRGCEGGVDIAKPILRLARDVPWAVLVHQASSLSCSQPRGNDRTQLLPLDRYFLDRVPNSIPVLGYNNRNPFTDVVHLIRG